MLRECIFCGTVLEDNNKGYTCKDCESKMKLLKQLNKIDNSQVKIEKAVKRYLHKDCSYQNERDAIVRKILNDGFSFRSEAEACFALQLEKEEIAYYPNYKIGDNEVDFLLPNMKRIIEIDGELYHTDEDKDFLRERSIMRSAGEDHEIVRIPASYVPEYIIKNLGELIDFVVDKRKMDGHFRDTRWDANYMGEYLSLQNHLRRSAK